MQQTFYTVVLCRRIVPLLPFLLCLIPLYLNNTKTYPLFDLFFQLLFFLHWLTIYSVRTVQFKAAALQSVSVDPWGRRELASEYESAQYFFYWESPKRSRLNCRQLAQQWSWFAFWCKLLVVDQLQSVGQHWSVDYSLRSTVWEESVLLTDSSLSPFSLPIHLALKAITFI